MKIFIIYMGICVWCILFYIHVHIFVKRRVRKLLMDKYENIPRYLIIYPMSPIDILLQFIPLLNIIFCLDLFLSVEDYTEHTYNYLCVYIEDFLIPILEEMEKQTNNNTNKQ